MLLLKPLTVQRLGSILRRVTITQLGIVTKMFEVRYLQYFQMLALVLLTG